MSDDEKETLVQKLTDKLVKATQNATLRVAIPAGLSPEAQRALQKVVSQATQKATPEEMVNFLRTLTLESLRILDKIKIVGE